MQLQMRSITRLTAVYGVVLCASAEEDRGGRGDDAAAHPRRDAHPHVQSAAPHPLLTPPPAELSLPSFSCRLPALLLAELVEEEVEIEVDEDEEWEEDDDAAAANPTPLAPPSPSSPSLPHTIRIDPSTTNPLTSPFPPAPTSSLRPPSHLLTPSFSPNLLPPSSPSFSPSFPTAADAADDGRMREVADMVDAPSPVPPSPPSAGEGGQRGGQVGMEEEGKGEKKAGEGAVVGLDRASVLRAELVGVERRLEEARALVDKQANRILQRKVNTERVAPLEAERDRLLAELAALSTNPPA